MKLEDYIKSQRGTAIRIAKQAGVAPSTITRIVVGKMMPSRAVAEAISAACDGKVSVQEVYGFEAAV